MRQLGHHYLMALPTSRTVALDEAARKKGQFVVLDTLDFPDKQPQLVYLRSVAQTVLAVRQGFANQDGSQGAVSGQQRYEPELRADNDDLSETVEKRIKLFVSRNTTNP